MALGEILDNYFGIILFIEEGKEMFALAKKYVNTRGSKKMKLVQNDQEG